jgi:hypothetical protein
MQQQQAEQQSVGVDKETTPFKLAKEKKGKQYYKTTGKPLARCSVRKHIPYQKITYLVLSSDSTFKQPPIHPTLQTLVKQEECKRNSVFGCWWLHTSCSFKKRQEQRKWLSKTLILTAQEKKEARERAKAAAAASPLSSPLPQTTTSPHGNLNNNSSTSSSTTTPLSKTESKSRPIDST